MTINQIINDRQGKQRAFMNSDYQKGNKKKLITLKQGQSFGMYGFFTGVERIVNVYSNKFSTIIKIDRKKMLEILKENPRDYEKFMEVKDKIYFDQNFQDLNLNCIICQSQEHLFERCDRAHLNKSNPIIYYKFNHSIGQKRQSAIRNQIKHKNIKLTLELNSIAINKLREEYNLYDDEDEDEDYQEDDDDEYIDDDEEDYNEGQHYEAEGPSLFIENISSQQMPEKDDHEQNNNKTIQEHHSNIIISNNLAGNILSNLGEDNNDEVNVDIDAEYIEKELKNEKVILDSISSSQEISSQNKSEDVKIPDVEYQEVRSKKSLHFMNKKQDKYDGIELNERFKSQENTVINKSRSSLRNEMSSLEYDDTIQKKVIKLKNPTASQKRRLSQKSIDKLSTLQEDILPQNPSGFMQPSKLQPMQISSHDEIYGTRQSIQQRIRYDKMATKGGIQTNKRMSIRQQNRVSLSRNTTLGNGINQQILFKKVGSQFQAVASNQGEDIPLYWRMDSMKNYLIYYPEYNSNDVIKRVQMYQMRQNRKKYKNQKKLAQSMQMTQLNFSRLKSNLFQSTKIQQNPSQIYAKINQSRPSQIEEKDQ